MLLDYFREFHVGNCSNMVCLHVYIVLCRFMSFIANLVIVFYLVLTFVFRKYEKNKKKNKNKSNSVLVLSVM